MAVREVVRSATREEKRGRVSGSRDQHWCISEYLREGEGGREGGRGR